MQSIMVSMGERSGNSVEISFLAHVLRSEGRRTFSGMPLIFTLFYYFILLRRDLLGLPFWLSPTIVLHRYDHGHLQNHLQFQSFPLVDLQYGKLSGPWITLLRRIW